MIEWKQMTMQEAENKMEVLREIFDVVRLLKGSDLQTSGMENKLEGEKNLCQCYAFWNKDKRCENCISVKALNEKKQTSKIEFLDSDMYQVFARYLEIDSEPYVMEMLKKLDENTLTDEEGYEKLTEKLTVYSEKLYKDVLTGAYNRRYFEEKVKNMSLNAGVAVIDLDDFKLFNDTYGHDGGDLVLTTVVNVIRHYIRRTDILVRYGGDEFLLILPGIEKEIFSQKLRMIQEKIHATHIPGFNRLKLSVSIGGAMFTHGRLEEAITKADRFMYMAKGHKNIVVTRWDQKQNTDRVEKRNLPQLLVVDDSEMNREILKEILGKEYRILEACDGEEALKMLEQQGTEISLVLLDIIMPKMDGFEVLAYMNRDKWIEDIPVIMISSEGSESYIRRAYELGASDYISRPFDTKVVYQRVINMIKLYAKQRRLIHLVTDQIYEKEKNNRMMTGILSQIVEFRNGESGLHVLHINILTQLLLERLMRKSENYNFSWSQQHMIATASALHDIGKIGIDEKILNKPGKLTKEDLRSFRPSVCNRLDRNTSGLVAAGCSLAGLQRLSAMFKDRSLHKYYLCVVSGSVREKKRIEGFLKKDEKTNQVTISKRELPDSAPICTEYEPLIETGSYTLLKVTLITGRTHQIRAHLASIGHPIVGDMKYGNPKVNEEAKRQYHIHSQMLHSWKLVFPQMEEPLAHLSGKSFTAPLPGEFTRVLGSLPEGVR